MFPRWNFFTYLCYLLTLTSVFVSATPSPSFHDIHAGTDQQTPLSPDTEPLAGLSQGSETGVKKSPLTDEFRTLVESLLDEWTAPGVAVAVVEGDDVWAEVGLSLLFPSFFGYCDCLICSLYFLPVFRDPSYLSNF